MTAGTQEGCASEYQGAGQGRRACAPNWRSALKASPSTEEVGEPVNLVKVKGKQMVFRLQVKGKDGQPFWVRALLDTGEQARLIRTGLARDLVKPSKRPLRLVTASEEVLGGGDKEA